MTLDGRRPRVALIEAGSPGLNIYSHVAMGRGVSLLATVLRDEGFEARAFIEDVSGKGSVDWEWVAGADVVGFSTITCTVPRTRDLMRRAREVAPEAVVVLGGPEPTCHPERSLGLGADFVFRGEAEGTLPRFVRVVTGGEEERLEDIEGLVWREEGMLREGPSPRQLTRSELDALPLVDRSLVHNADMSSVASVWRGRGCPERCDFCEVNEIWPRYVRRDDAHSVEELIRAQDDGYGVAFLVDDNAAANKPAFKQFLREIAESGFVRALTVQLRADSVFTREGRLDRELLRLLKKAASVTLVCIGVESADDDNLDRLHKGVDASKTARALKAMRRYGLLVHGMFIALKEDSREVIRRNGEYARRYVTSLQYLFEVPLPGTKRTREHEDSGALLFDEVDDLELYDGMHVVLKPERMAPHEMQELVTEAYRRFYSVRRIVAAALSGAFVRHRILSAAQRAKLKQLSFWRRIRRWAWFHIEYRFAPVSFLAIGRRRVHDILSDPSYQAYVERLRAP